MTASQALYAVGSDHGRCLSSDGHRTFTEGLDTIADRGPGPVRIDRAEWLGNKGFKLLAIGVLQRQDNDMFATLQQPTDAIPAFLVRDVAVQGALV